MKKRWLFSVLLSVIILVAGCTIESEETNTGETIGNPSAKEILTDNPEADIFLYNRIVYSNADDIDWVNELELTPGEEVTEITKQTTIIDKFESGTASKLPVGTKIYKPVKDSSVYIAVVDGKEIPYIGLIEG